MPDNPKPIHDGYKYPMVETKPTPRPTMMQRARDFMKPTPKPTAPQKQSASVMADRRHQGRTLKDE